MTRESTAERKIAKIKNYFFFLGEVQRFVSKKKENDKKSFPSKRPYEKENGRRKDEYNQI